MAESVKEFLRDCYRLVTSHNAGVPLRGTDTSDGLKIMNRVLSTFSATGMLLTITQTIELPIAQGKDFITFGLPTDIPLPDITIGRLANIQTAWLNSNGITYPLTSEDLNSYNQSYKYTPQTGLPLFYIIDDFVNGTGLRLYPGPAQSYVLFINGKFQTNIATENADMSGLPDYYLEFLQFAVAKKLAFNKGRSAAWTPDLEDELENLRRNMINQTPVNVDISAGGDDLWGANRVASGLFF